MARIFENRPLQCSRCGGPLRIVAIIFEREVIAKILRRLGEVSVVGPGIVVERAVAAVRDGPEPTRGRDRDEVGREIGGKDVAR